MRPPRRTWQATIGGRTAGAGLAAPRPYPVLAASIGHRWPAALLVRSRYVSAVRLTSQDRLAPGGQRDRCYREPRERHRTGRRRLLGEVHAVHGAHPRRFARRAGERGRRPGPRSAPAGVDGPRAIEEDGRSPGPFRGCARRAVERAVGREAPRSRGARSGRPVLRHRCGARRRGGRCAGGPAAGRPVGDRVGADEGGEEGPRESRGSRSRRWRPRRPRWMPRRRCAMRNSQPEHIAELKGIAPLTLKPEVVIANLEEGTQVPDELGERGGGLRGDRGRGRGDGRRGGSRAARGVRRHRAGPRDRDRGVLPGAGPDHVPHHRRGRDAGVGGAVAARTHPRRPARSTPTCSAGSSAPT